MATTVPDRIYTGSIGVPIRVVLLDGGQLFDPTNATVRHLTIIKPDGTRVVRDQDTDPAVEVGTTKPSTAYPAGRVCLEYVTEEGLLDQEGTYRCQGYLEDEVGRWPTATFKFKVYESLVEFP